MRQVLLTIKYDMVYRGLTREKAEERFNQNVSPQPPADKSP